MNNRREEKLNRICMNGVVKVTVGKESAATNASVIEFAHQPEEPMIHTNYGASDQQARERMWRHAQCQTNEDRKPLIPMQPNISEAPDVKSQATLRR